MTQFWGFLFCAIAVNTGVYLAEEGYTAIGCIMCFAIGMIGMFFIVVTNSPH